MSMKITAIIYPRDPDGEISAEGEDTRHRAVLPWADADHVLCDAPCPTCGDAHALVDADGRVLALARPVGLAAAKREHKRATVLPPPDGCKLRGVSMSDAPDDDGWNADARCLRCGRIIGRLEVRVNTIFGVKEDRAVLQGRCRVY